MTIALSLVSTEQLNWEFFQVFLLLVFHLSLAFESFQFFFSFVSPLLSEFCVMSSSRALIEIRMDPFISQI